MTKFKVLKMHFSSPLHIGQGVTESYGRSGRILHSDSISGALAATFSSLYPDEDVKQFMESFQVSSAFPFSGEKLFFPKPMIKLLVSSENESLVMTKKLKKLEYFDQSSFETILQGKELNVSTAEQLAGDGRFFLAKPERSFQTPYSSTVVQRVAVPRGDGGDASPFYFERLTFEINCGFWCFFEVAEDYQNRFLKCLIHLGENGIGTDRTVGNGQFNVEIDSLDLALPESNGNNLSLSLFWPAETEINGLELDKSAYLLKKRGGFIAGSSHEQFRHLRRKSVYMFVEGSVFAGKIEGKIDNLRPDWNDSKLHPVWRDGRAFSLPIIVNS